MQFGQVRIMVIGRGHSVAATRRSQSDRRIHRLMSESETSFDLGHSGNFPLASLASSNYHDESATHAAQHGTASSSAENKNDTIVEGQRSIFASDAQFAIGAQPADGETTKQTKGRRRERNNFRSFPQS
jgi:hypothetical protein